MKEGSIVKLAVNSRFYGINQETNPVNVEGKVTDMNLESSHGLNIQVKWPSGMMNAYNKKDLIVIK